MLGRIAAVVEPTRRDVSLKEMYAGLDLRGRMRPQHLIAASIEASLEYLSPAAVFVDTRTGATARRLAAFHLPAWIVALGDQEKTCQDLIFSYGVHPVYQPKPPASWPRYVKEWLQRHEVPGEFALVTHGPAAREEATHGMEVIEL
jgi:pyruvate kinase